MIRRYLNIKIFLLPFVLLFDTTLSAQITILPSQVAQALAQKLAGQGITILNPILQCPTQANGFFNAAGSNFGLDSGIVLTTGRAATQGSNYGVNGYSINLASNDNGAPGDPSLDALAGQHTVDACTLEFDVIPNGDTIKFNYVFSSEEYKNAVCGPYNDAFAFFISGPGIAGSDNLALIPGTDIPVEINTINNGTPGITGNIRNCTMIGPGSPFTTYYIDNSGGTTLTHQGFTKVLKAIHAVTPCSTYHLKIVIADAGDALYDSGVFLEAGSLQTSSFAVSAVPSLVSGNPVTYCIKGCQPGRFRIKRTLLEPTPQLLKLKTAGSAVGGIDYATFPDSVVIPADDTIADVIINGLPTALHGAKEIKLYVMSPYLCNGLNNIVDSASLVIFDSLYINIAPRDTIICGRDSVALQVNGSDLLTYSWSPKDGLSNSAIKDPIAFPVVNTSYVVTGTLPGTLCMARQASVSFGIKLTPDPKMATDTTVCFNTHFRFDAAATDSNYYYSYHWSGPNNYTSTLLNPPIDTMTSLNEGIYTLTVLNDTNLCTGTAFINVAVNTPPLPVTTSLVTWCLNNPAVALTAKGNHLLWYDTGLTDSSTTAPVPPVNELASYDYYVSQTIGNCESPKAHIAVEIKKCCDGKIVIPTAFTPNGDGRNDQFEPIEDYGYYINTMYIFNRWGQLVYSGNKGIWDGTFGGRPAETGTYYYRISFGCFLGGELERKGDVTLIR